MPVEFNSLTPELIHRRSIVHDACRKYNHAPSKGNLKRIQGLLGIYGESLRIEQGFYCDYGDKIFIGNRVYININCTLLDGGKITLGDDVLIGPNVQILTVNHPTDPQQRLTKTSYIKDVTIGNNVWIGAGAIILPGVTIGDGAVIGAASLVSKDVKSYCLYLGNPARMVRKLK